eukprot:scaffold24337_cov82-Cyclotella_meneghiniana.AAC.5
MQNTAKIKGVCEGNGCSGCERPPRANRGLQLLPKWYLQAADEAPAVGGPVLTMLWAVKSLDEVEQALQVQKEGNPTLRKGK